MRLRRGKKTHARSTDCAASRSPSYRQRDLPVGPARAGLLLLHGFTGSRTEFTYLFVHLARLLTARGIAVFRFDFAGCGESDGDFAELSMADQAAQTAAMLDQVQANYPELQWHVLGFSMGALAATLVAPMRPELASLMLLAPAGNIDSVLKALALQPPVAGGLRLSGADHQRRIIERSRNL